MALLAPGTAWAFVLITAPLFSDLGALEPVPVWGPYGWWLLKPVSLLGATILCLGGAASYAINRRFQSASAAPMPT